MLIALSNVNREEGAVTWIWVGLDSIGPGRSFAGEPSGSVCQLLIGDQAIFYDKPSYHASAKIEVLER
jgi:hypothetical protein